MRKVMFAMNISLAKGKKWIKYCEQRDDNNYY